ncbi:MAG: hypothetical protein ABI054_03530 [Planctomycetota bacterium]
MLDPSNRVQFLSPRTLLVETTDPFPLRFSHVVMITRVVLRHGGGVTIESGGMQFDASSAFEIIQSLGFNPAATRFAFQGPEPALQDLSRLCRHLLIEDKSDSWPDDLQYLRQ